MTRIATRTAFGLLIAMAVTLAAATFVEKAKGTDFAVEHIYGSWWFVALWAALFAAAAAVVTLRALYRRRPAFLLHVSFGVILAGAFLTFMTAQKGYVHLREGEEVSAFVSEADGTPLPLPFGLTLERFEIEHYRGTLAPADYRSRLVVRDGGDRFPAEISMNRILSHRGYRFYQTSFDEDGRGSVLSVNRDPYGIPVTYTGYILLAVSMIWLLVSRRAGFRRLLENPLLRRAGTLAVLLAVAAGTRAATPTLSRENAATFGKLQMLYGNRIAPVQTFARDFTLKIYGKPTYRGLSAEQVLAGWIFYPEQWQHERMIGLGDPEVGRLIGSPGKRAAFTDFFDAERRYKLAPYRKRMHHDGERSALSRAVEKADEKVQLIAMLQAGEILTLFPEAHDGGLRWVSPAGSADGFTGEDSLFVRGIFPLLYEAVTGGEEILTGKLIEKIDAFQRKQAGADLRPDRQIAAERLYNRLDLVTILYRFNLALGMLAFGYFCAALLTTRRRWPETAFAAALAVSFAALTADLLLRWYVAGHIPLSNGYETMTFVAWCVMGIALIFRRRFFLAAASGFVISGFALLVAALGIMNPQITPLMPVLASPWLSLHVSLIMVSYALLAFIALNGLTALILIVSDDPSPGGRIARQAETLRLASRLFLYPAVFFLAAGIFVGAVWANVSWGRYWGWDPKEVWALITLMLYALPIHTGSLGRFNRPVFFHAFCVWAFSSVLMTYFGVNYFLGGMHSYAGTLEPGVPFILIGSAAILLSALTAAASLKHRRYQTRR